MKYIRSVNPRHLLRGGVKGCGVGDSKTIQRSKTIIMIIGGNLPSLLLIGCLNPKGALRRFMWFGLYFFAGNRWSSVDEGYTDTLEYRRVGSWPVSCDVGGALTTRPKQGVNHRRNDNE